MKVVRIVLVISVLSLIIFWGMRFFFPVQYDSGMFQVSDVHSTDDGEIIIKLEPAVDKGERGNFFDEYKIKFDSNESIQLNEEEFSSIEARELEERLTVGEDETYSAKIETYGFPRSLFNKHKLVRLSNASEINF